MISPDNLNCLTVLTLKKLVLLSSFDSYSFNLFPVSVLQSYTPGASSGNLLRGNGRLLRDPSKAFSSPDWLRPEKFLSSIFPYWPNSSVLEHLGDPWLLPTTLPTIAQKHARRETGFSEDWSDADQPVASSTIPLAFFEYRFASTINLPPSVFWSAFKTSGI